MWNILQFSTCFKFTVSCCPHNNLHWKQDLWYSPFCWWGNGGCMRSPSWLHPNNFTSCPLRVPFVFYEDINRHKEVWNCKDKLNWSGILESFNDNQQNKINLFGILGGSRVWTPALPLTKCRGFFDLDSILCNYSMFYITMGCMMCIQVSWPIGDDDSSLRSLFETLVQCE